MAYPQAKSAALHLRVLCAPCLVADLRKDMMEAASYLREAAWVGHIRQDKGRHRRSPLPAGLAGLDTAPAYCILPAAHIHRVAGRKGRFGRRQPRRAVYS